MKLRDALKLSRVIEMELWAAEMVFMLSSTAVITLVLVNLIDISSYYPLRG